MTRYFISLFSLLLVAFVVPVQGVESTSTEPEATGNASATAFYSRMDDLYQSLKLESKGLRKEVFQKALVGYLNLKANGELSGKPFLTIVDFEQSSVQKRLWVLDIENQRVLHHTLVVHGRNTGEEYARRFSNIHQSFMSSLGFYVTEETYMGKHGLSLKLRGMDEQFNTNAMDRVVVMYGADYVSEDFIRTHGRLGRSHGCPALPMDLHQEIINTVKDRTAMYLHYPEQSYDSKYLDESNAMKAYFNQI